MLFCLGDLLTERFVYGITQLNCLSFKKEEETWIWMVRLSSSHVVHVGVRGSTLERCCLPDLEVSITNPWVTGCLSGFLKDGASWKVSSLSTAR